MSNQYRVERDRDVLVVVDAGRLMLAPIGDRSRLDLALDVATAVGLAADALGDRCGAVAFDDDLRRVLRPSRGGGAGLVRRLYDLDARPVDSDYEAAFRAVGGAKRAFVLVLTDLLDEAAAGPLVRAAPLLAGRHAVVVLSPEDPDLRAAVGRTPQRPADVYAAAVALDVLAARGRAAGRIRATGARVVQAPADGLAGAGVAAYLAAKDRWAV